jgi:nucleoside-diphosphate-sugar epimerase
MTEHYPWNNQISKLSSDDRVLITGASGWFGRNALEIIRSFGLKHLALGSEDRTLVCDGFEIQLYKQSLNKIREFSPTIIIDSAFLTRDKLANIERDRFISVNRKLINDSLEMASLPSVRKYVGFSSGATVNLAGESSFSLLDNPYAALKREYEDVITELSGPHKGKISIARVWSVTGAHVTKPELFAFSNLINQARAGQVFIKSQRLVFRRYCTIADVLLVALADSGEQGPIFDTGGELIEIGKLAEIIVQEVNPAAGIVRDLLESSGPDNYFSDGRGWDKLINAFHIRPSSIRDQVRAFAKSINT